MTLKLQGTPPPSPRCVCIYLYWFERHTNLSVANGYYKSSGKEGMKTQRPIYPKLCSRMWSDQKDRDRERETEIANTRHHAV